MNVFIPSKGARPYAGAYWEREFKGEARAAAGGWPPSLKGDPGLGEMELSFKPDPDKQPQSLEVGAQARFGRQEGRNAALKLNWEF